METKHSPLPWKVRDKTLNGRVIVESANGNGIAHVWTNAPNVGDAEARQIAAENAGLIALAVNCRDELLAACKAALDNLSEVHGREEQWACGQLRAAIAKAEGQDGAA